MPALQNLRQLVWTGCSMWLGFALASSCTAQERSIEVLQLQLRQTQPAQRISAARTLAELGPTASHAASGLINCLEDPNNDVRVVAAYALARVTVDPYATISALLPLLSDSNEHVRYSAQWSVAYVAAEINQQSTGQERARTLALLEQVLEEFKMWPHQSRHVAAVEHALAALRETNDDAKQVTTSAASPLPPWVAKIYESADTISRIQIIEQLSDAQQFPRELRQQVLLHECAQNEFQLIEYALERWGSVGQSDLADLLQQLDTARNFTESTYLLLESFRPANHDSVSLLKRWSTDVGLPIAIRTTCIRALSQSQYDLQGCVDYIASTLTNVELQMYAAYALNDLGPAARSAEPQLISALMQSPDGSLYISGLQALASIASNSTVAAEFLTRWLEKSPGDAEHLPYLLEAISNFGALASAAMPLIREHLRNSSEDTQYAAATALGRLGSMADAAVPDLIQVLCQTDAWPPLTTAAAQTLQAIGPTAARGLVHRLQASQDEAEQLMLMRALTLHEAQALPALAFCEIVLKDSSASDLRRCAAATLMGSMGPAAGTATATQLLAHCRDTEPDAVHAMCLLAAARIDASAARPLAELAVGNESLVIRANAAFALHLTGASRRAFDNLLDMLADDDSNPIIQSAIIDLGEVTQPWLLEQTENYQRTDIQRITCCQIASGQSNPDWVRLFALVEDPSLGQQFADALAFHWHTEIACCLSRHPREVQTLLTTLKSDSLEPTARGRLADLLIPEGLGAGDEGTWGGLALADPLSIQALSQSNAAVDFAAGEMPAAMAAPEMAAMPMELPSLAAKKNEESAIDSAIESGLRNAAQTQAEVTSGVISPDALRSVEVFYGTNRQRDPLDSSMKQIIVSILIVTGGTVLIFGLCTLLCFVYGKRLLGVVSLGSMAAFGIVGLLAAKQLSAHRVQNIVAYNQKYSQAIEYGSCTITFPPNHQPGVVEAPMLLKGELITDPTKHVVLKEIRELSHDEFLDDVKAMQARKGKNLLVFVHGYNVSFEDAAKRTAQMAFDVDFPGAPIFYSWPSQANWYGYKTDQRQIQQSIDQIKLFLEDLAAKSGADTINLVAHSMGNVGLTAALKEMQTNDNQPIFNQVVLAAPDVDAEVFKRDIAPFIVNKAKRTTLYTSKTDLALIASRYFNNAPRLGDSGPEIVTFPGIETIDATTVDSSLLGHSYYGSNVSVLTDVGHLLRNEPIGDRSYLRPTQLGSLSYWTFDPVLLSRAPSSTQPLIQK